MTNSKTVEPIRKLKNVQLIKGLLSDRPGDPALVAVGINASLRAGDLLSVRAGQVRHPATGDSVAIKEKKGIFQ